MLFWCIEPLTEFGDPRGCCCFIDSVESLMFLEDVRMSPLPCHECHLHDRNNVRMMDCGHDFRMAEIDSTYETPEVFDVVVVEAMVGPEH